jgi:hypothetical protein
MNRYAIAAETIYSNPERSNLELLAFIEADSTVEARESWLATTDYEWDEIVGGDVFVYELATSRHFDFPAEAV